MILLDTNVISELMASTPDWRVQDFVDEQSKTRIYTSAISVAEILYGIHRLPDGRRSRILPRASMSCSRVCSPTVFLTSIASCAMHYAIIAVRRERAGRRTEVLDAQIAAVCALHSATLVTRNIRDFGEMGIDLINPWEGDAH